MPRFYLLKEAERDIFSRVNGKNWNLYDSTDVQTRADASRSLRAGPAVSLEHYRRYVLMPIVPHPKDPDAVFEGLERIARDILHRRLTIRVRNGIFDWTGFIPMPDLIKINTPEGHLVSYREFVDCLNSLAQI